jgi:hypothetical protein
MERVIQVARKESSMGTCRYAALPYVVATVERINYAKISTGSRNCMDLMLTFAARVASSRVKLRPATWLAPLAS